ncbi:tyrosine-type recombinase/integrase [Thalassotalea piscium]|uniref:Site-specific recombinase XerD n=1 Tax=Thalassotalea piscium TaxID=1230533 RepID=A0A7X0NJV4_9GAMM|nr:tyrosine-type recombinase/integrase [Thalassotalea piscium]MBB6544750.1 site-specific recombinase XerD [Thalassotalea piscium]
MSELTLRDLNVIVPEHHKEAANKYFTDIFNLLPANTQRSYKSDLKQYYDFCFANDLPGLTPDMELTEKSIKAYVMTMCESQLAHNTIVHRMATLSKFMAVAKFPNPLKQSEYLRDFIKLQMKAHDIYARANQAPALRLRDLEQINNNVIPDTLLDIRDLAMINMMFDGLLRADEVAPVQMKHIIYKDNKILVPTSKTDQSGKGSLRYVSNTTLAYVSDYISEANIDRNTQLEKQSDDPTRINKGILFRPISPKGTTLLPYDESITRLSDMPKLAYVNIYKSLKRIAKKGGVDIPISGHSPRVGAAVTMAENKVSTKEIQDAGDWKSPDMPARYTEQAQVESGMSKLADIFRR